MSTALDAGLGGVILFDLSAGVIDVNLAPVVDVNVNTSNPAVGAIGRSFSGDPATVAAMAEAEIHGLHEYGIRAAIGAAIE